MKTQMPKNEIARSIFNVSIFFANKLQNNLISDH